MAVAELPLCAIVRVKSCTPAQSAVQVWLNAAPVLVTVVVAAPSVRVNEYAPDTLPTVAVNVTEFPEVTVPGEAARPVIAGFSMVLTRSNCTEAGVVPLAEAVTAYGPPVVALAVAFTEAMPLPIVAVVLVRVAPAPDDRVKKLTTPPSTGSPLLLLTDTRSKGCPDVG